MDERNISRNVQWQKCRRGEIKEAMKAGGLVLLPTGAIEQHGPHLPLDTDSFTSFTISIRAAEQVDEFPVLVLPPIWWGLSPYWLIFPGTLSLRAETLIDVIFDIARSVAHHGFRKLVIVNGHGGNTGLIQAAAVKASTDGFQVAALSYWNLIPDVMRTLSDRDDGWIGHAGEMETSIQLYLQRECVELQEVRPEQCMDLRARAAMVASAGAQAVYLPPNPQVESPHGVYGAAHAGTAEKGKNLIEAATHQLVAFLRTFHGSQLGS